MVSVISETPVSLNGGISVSHHRSLWFFWEEKKESLPAIMLKNEQLMCSSQSLVKFLLAVPDLVALLSRCGCADFCGCG